ncbi:MAG: transposase [Candidatus Cloacimonetes bacterium]|nr:transposase [Candidatus Cloacimonadota bacterium]
MELKYSDNGQHGYNPKILTAILFYEYTIGINSSRKLSDACLERFDFRYSTFNQFPSYKTISEFRRENLSFLKDQFTNIVLIGLDLGLADFGNIKVSIDGTKIRANASSKRSKNLKGLKKLREQIEKEITKLLMNSEIIDREESVKLGNKSEHELPKKLQSKKSYVKSINKAINKLTELQADMKQTELSEKGHITKSKMRAIENQKINITDHDAKFMKERNGCIRTNYNSHISVDEKNQFILANHVCNSASNQHQLIPLIEESEKNIAGKINIVKSDSGYENVENLKYLESNDIAHFVDSQRRNKIGSTKYKYNKINFEYDPISNLICAIYFEIRC